MLTKIIPSYLYVQYRDEPAPLPPASNEIAVAGIAIAGFAVAGVDPHYVPPSSLQAFVNAYNSMAQGYLDSLNDLSLPIYTKQSGLLLDWVAYGLYGMHRPSLSVGSLYTPFGVYDTVTYNETAYTEDVKSDEQTSYTVTDDYFKRILTWNFYKGDTFQFTIPWFKRRIKRFLYGKDGVDFWIDNTYEINVENPTGTSFVITIPNVDAAPIFEAALLQGFLNVPFQFTYTVNY